MTLSRLPTIGARRVLLPQETGSLHQLQLRWRAS